MDATQLHTRGDIVLAESRASGEIRLLGAHIAGELNCHDATLTNDAGPALNADGLRVDQGMFCDGSFRASGEIRLLGGHIAGQLSLSGATLTNDSGPALNADRLRVDQGRVLRRVVPRERRDPAGPRAHRRPDQLPRRDADERLRDDAYRSVLGPEVVEAARRAPRALIALAIIASLLFGVVFEATTTPGGDLTPARAVSQTAPFQPVLYAIDILLPVVSLGQDTAWNAHGAAQWATAASTLLGWLLTTAFVAGLIARRA